MIKHILVLVATIVAATAFLLKGGKQKKKGDN
jgi:hypothetical protein